MEGQAATRATELTPASHLHHNKTDHHIHTANTFTSADASPAAAPTTADISAADTAAPAHATANAATLSTAMQLPIQQLIQPSTQQEMLQLHLTSQHQCDQPLQGPRTSHLLSPDPTNAATIHASWLPCVWTHSQ